MEKKIRKKKGKLKKNKAAFCPKKWTACGLEVLFVISALYLGLARGKVLVFLVVLLEEESVCLSSAGINSEKIAGRNCLIKCVVGNNMGLLFACNACCLYCPAF